MVENKKIIHKGYSTGDYRQEIYSRAYHIGGEALMILIECESAGKPLAVGDNGDAYWLCQMNSNRHKIPKEYYQDRGFQLKYCNDKMKWGTKFYWLTRPLYKEGKYIGKCQDVVLGRFIIN